tara:strand:- start:26 stop:601 length:576 start_codon:yes stop_codon:yes gene_type:complete
MLSFIYLLVAASLSIGGILLWRLKKRPHTYKTAALCLWLGAYACLVNTSLLSAFIALELATLGINLALYVSVPMATLLLLDVALNWQWQRATWGRIFLSLAAMFELMRRAETGNRYAEIMLIVCILASIFAAYSIIKAAKIKPQANGKLSLVLAAYLGLMVASLGALNSSFVLLWNALSLLTLGNYLYFAA